MRITDGSKGDSGKESNPTEEGENSSLERSSESESESISEGSSRTTTNDSSITRKSKHNRRKNKRRGRSRSLPRTLLPLPNQGIGIGTVLSQNGLTSPSTHQIIIENGYLSSPHKGMEDDRKNSENTTNTLRKVRRKRFPPTPNPLTENVGSKEKDGNNFLGKDLVDYEDAGSTSESISTCSDNENRNNKFHKKVVKVENHAQNITNAKNNTSSKSPVSSNFVSGAVLEDYDVIYRVMEGPYYDIDDDNAPCSSSSLRDKLNSQRSSVSTKAGELILTPIYDDIFEDETHNALDKGEGEEGVGENVSKAADKYGFSGVGRHFGKKKTLSMSNLSDGESASAASDRRRVMGQKILEWIVRLKAFSLVFMGTLFILSVSSLLFVFPILVDPILLGMEAEFSSEPVNCRTSGNRSGKGPTECSLPSCRAGCTADLFECTFIDVVYSYNISSDFSSTNIPETSSYPQLNYSTTEIPSQSDELIEVIKNGTLFININGCGYPPGVNCTKFINKYGKIGTTFRCYYSAKNDTFVVPYYNYDEEKYHLHLAIFVPIGLASFSVISLFLLLKCPIFCRPNRIFVLNKSSSQLKLLEEHKDSDKDKDKHSLSSGKSAKSVTKTWKEQKGKRKMNGNHFSLGENGEGPYVNGSLPKANGHAFQDTLVGLMGMKSPSQIQDNIRKLPHQHDSFEKHLTNDNESPQQLQQRKPRYTKKNEVNKGPPLTDPLFRREKEMPFNKEPEMMENAF